ncbi:MAG: glycosyltransferase [Halioglobus sp.]
MCNEITALMSGSVIYHERVTRLPRARKYLFPHYSLYVQALKLNPVLWLGERYVYYTHPKDIGVKEDDWVYAFNHATQIISGCEMFADYLKRKGVASHIVSNVIGAGYVVGAIRPHERGDGVVGLSSAYYPRKNPQLVADLVNFMPHRKFMLLGKGWEYWDGFAELNEKPNFEYLQLPYESYPAFYSLMDVFLSPSILEGGPVPLLEAMVCNIVPVASQTGFATELIRHGDNGFLFRVNAGAGEVAELIDRAFDLQADVSRDVAEYTWQRYAEKMLNVMGLDSNCSFEDRR